MLIYVLENGKRVFQRWVEDTRDAGKLKKQLAKQYPEGLVVTDKHAPAPWQKRDYSKMKGKEISPKTLKELHPDRLEHGEGGGAAPPRPNKPIKVISPGRRTGAFRAQPDEKTVENLPHWKRRGGLTQ
jgi:hypothetical protein